MKTVIIAHDQFDLVVKQIMGLLTYDGRKFSDIIVIDNFSDDDLGKYLKNQHDIDYIICDEKLEKYADILEVVISEFVEEEDLMVMTPAREGLSGGAGVLLTSEMIGRISDIKAINDRFFWQAPDTALLKYIEKDGAEAFSVLEIGCGIGTNLRHIKSNYPNARLCGIEENEEAVAVAGLFGEVSTENIYRDSMAGTVSAAFEGEKFDYIVFSGALERLQRPEQVLREVSSLLAPGGRILASVSNAAYFGTLRGLLSGTFSSVDSGNAEKDRLHLLGSREITDMFCENGLFVEKMDYLQEELNEDDEYLAESLAELSPAFVKTMISSSRCIIAAVQDEAKAVGQLELAQEKAKDAAMIGRLARNAKKAYKKYEYGRRLIPFKGKGVIYTVLTGGYDALNDPEYIDGQFDYVCFTDDPDLCSDIWQIRLVENPEKLDKTRLARKHKILCHKYLGEYDYSVYVDAKLKIIGDMGRYIEKYSKGSSMLCFPHHLQDCLYEEAEACKALGKDDYGVMSRQIEGYRKEGFPEHYGMVDTACLVRLHRDEILCRVMEVWWDEVKNKSKRDQLSFEYVCWKSGFYNDICDLFIYKNNYLVKRRTWEKSIE